MDKDYLGFLKGIKGLVKEEADIINYEGDGVKPDMEAKDEKETSDPMDHTEGSGTEQAGTSDESTFEGMADDLDDLLALEETISLFMGGVSLREQDEKDGDDYKAFFKKMLDKWNAKDPSDIPADKKDDFFKEVDAAWKSNKENLG